MQLITAEQQKRAGGERRAHEGSLLVDPPPHQLESAPTQAAQSPPGCGTGRVARRSHPAQADRRRPQKSLADPLAAKHTCKSGPWLLICKHKSSLKGRDAAGFLVKILFSQIPERAMPSFYHPRAGAEMNLMIDDPNG